MSSNQTDRRPDRNDVGRPPIRTRADELGPALERVAPARFPCGRRITFPSCYKSAPRSCKYLIRNDSSFRSPAPRLLQAIPRSAEPRAQSPRELFTRIPPRRMHRQSAVISPSSQSPYDPPLMRRSRVLPLASPTHRARRFASSRTHFATRDPPIRTAIPPLTHFPPPKTPSILHSTFATPVTNSGKTAHYTAPVASRGSIDATRIRSA